MCLEVCILFDKLCHMITEKQRESSYVREEAYLDDHLILKRANLKFLVETETQFLIDRYMVGGRVAPHHVAS